MLAVSGQKINRCTECLAPSGQSSVISGRCKAKQKVATFGEVRSQEEESQRALSPPEFEIPSRAPVCSRQALSVIANLHPYWKLVEAAADNEGELGKGLLQASVFNLSF